MPIETDPTKVFKIAQQIPNKTHGRIILDNIKTSATQYTLNLIANDTKHTIRNWITQHIILNNTVLYEITESVYYNVQSNHITKDELLRRLNVSNSFFVMEKDKLYYNVIIEEQDTYAIFHMRLQNLLYNSLYHSNLLYRPITLPIKIPN